MRYLVLAIALAFVSPVFASDFVCHVYNGSPGAKATGVVKYVELETFEQNKELITIDGYVFSAGFDTWNDSSTVRVSIDRGSQTLAARGNPNAGIVGLVLNDVPKASYAINCAAKKFNLKQ